SGRGVMLRAGELGGLGRRLRGRRWMGGGFGRPGAAVIIALSGNVIVIRVRIPCTVRGVVVARAAHVMIVGIDVVRGDFWFPRAAADNPGSGQRTGQHQTDNPGTFHRRRKSARRHPMMDAAMMMQTPRMTAAPTMAAATFLFSTISLCRLPGVHRSNIL